MTGSTYYFAAVTPVLPKDVFPVRKHQRYASCGARLSLELGRHVDFGQPAEWSTGVRTGRAFRTPAMTTNRYALIINQKDTTWFRFRWSTGVQAAYTDPINSLFDAVSPQPLYLFAAGYTHVFSQNVVNYFNPRFSWYESLSFGPANLQKALAAFPIVLQGSGANAPFTTIGGLDNTWVQRR